VGTVDANASERPGGVGIVVTQSPPDSQHRRVTLCACLPLVR
jgi:hypothetical protein